VARAINGYAGTYSTNDNFANAIPSQHALADLDVTNLNTAITNCIATWDGMVQLVDLDGAFGADANVPNSIHSYFSYDGLHTNENGQVMIVRETIKAYNKLVAPATDEVTGELADLHCGSLSLPTPDRRVIRSGQVYTSECRQLSGTVTAVVGDLWASPYYFCESNLMLTTIYVEQTNAPATSGSSIRCGIYDDINYTGYPQNLRYEFTFAGAFAMGTTAAMKTVLSNLTYATKQGLYWLVLKVDALGTNASIFRAILGPSRYMPNWAAAGGSATPAGWKVSGVTSPAALPGFFPTGGTLQDYIPAVGFTLVKLS